MTQRTVNRWFVFTWIMLITMSGLTGFNLSYLMVDISLFNAFLVSLNVWTLLIWDKTLSSIKREMRHAEEVY